MVFAAIGLNVLVSHAATNMNEGSPRELFPDYGTVSAQQCTESEVGNESSDEGAAVANSQFWKVWLAVLRSPDK